MSTHYTIRVSINETTTTTKRGPGYNDPEITDRNSEEIATLVIRADSIESAHAKVRAVMDGALPLPEKVETSIQHFNMPEVANKPISDKL
jgi:hypothetical protein